MHDLQRFSRGPLCVLVAVLLPTAAVSGPDDASTLRSASLAATCNACHGASTQDAVLPGLHDRSVEQIRESMLAFKRGTLPGTVMPQLAKGYSDLQIARIAAFYGSRPAAPRR